MDQPNNNMNNNHPQGCMCGMCKGHNMSGTCCGGHHMGIYVLRWILGIIIILMIFSLGVSIGEFKGEVMGGGSIYRGSMMYDGYNGGYALPMMRVTTGTTATPAVAPTTK